MHQPNASANASRNASPADDEPDGLISIRQAAKRLGINKSTLARQVSSGAIRSHDGQLRFSEVLEDRANNINLGKARATEGKRGKTKPEEIDEGPQQLGMIEVDGALLPFADAARLKENYLARLRKLEFEVKSGSLVDRAAAERAFFEIARDIRDAWLGWPARVATLMASELGLEARPVAETLTRHVEQHLGELGEPTVPELAHGHGQPEGDMAARSRTTGSD